jgi:hypothetical protein
LPAYDVVWYGAVWSFRLSTAAGAKIILGVWQLLPLIYPPLSFRSINTSPSPRAPRRPQPTRFQTRRLDTPVTAIPVPSAAPGKSKIVYVRRFERTSLWTTRARMWPNLVALTLS